MKQKVFFTGATGFLGRATLPRLIKEGYEVCALVRSDHSEKIARELGARPIRGDIADTDSFEQELRGVGIVIHAAAPVEFWGPWDFFQKNIVEATKSLARAAERQNVRRFIYISSESVLQDKKPLLDIDETEPYPKEPNSYYGKAKKEAELFLLGEADRERFAGKMEVVILRPTFIWGPGMAALDTMLEKIKKGEFLWIDHGRTIIEMVHVQNVAQAICLACYKGKNRGIYFITDEQAAPAQDFLGALIRSRGIEPPEKNIPSWMASLAALLTEGAYKLFRSKKAPPLSRFELSFVNMPRRYNIQRARTELGYKAQTFPWQEMPN